MMEVSVHIWNVKEHSPTFSILQTVLEEYGCVFILLQCSCEQYPRSLHGSSWPSRLRRHYCLSGVLSRQLS